MPLWIPIAITAALFQCWRTAMQQKLRGILSVNGAGFVRYLYGMPTALVLFCIALAWTLRHPSVVSIPKAGSQGADVPAMKLIIAVVALVAATVPVAGENETDAGTLPTVDHVKLRLAASPSSVAAKDRLTEVPVTGLTAGVGPLAMTGATLPSVSVMVWTLELLSVALLGADKDSTMVSSCSASSSARSGMKIVPSKVSAGIWRVADGA